MESNSIGYSEMRPSVVNLMQSLSPFHRIPEELVFKILGFFLPSDPSFKVIPLVCKEFQRISRVIGRECCKNKWKIETPTLLDEIDADTFLDSVITCGGSLSWAYSLQWKIDGYRFIAGDRDDGWAAGIFTIGIHEYKGVKIGKVKVGLFKGEELIRGVSYDTLLKKEDEPQDGILATGKQGRNMVKKFFNKSREY